MNTFIASGKIETKAEHGFGVYWFIIETEENERLSLDYLDQEVYNNLEEGDFIVALGSLHIDSFGENHMKYKIIICEEKNFIWKGGM